MPSFRVYFVPEMTGNEPLEIDLGLTADAIEIVKGPVAEKRRSDLSEPHGFAVLEILAVEDVPDCKVSDGDVVWRNWPLFEGQYEHMPGFRLEQLMDVYKPIWEPGPGWLELQKWRSSGSR